jgi:hypothetical protein
MDVAYLFLLVLGGCIVALLLTADLKPPFARRVGGFRFASSVGVRATPGLRMTLSRSHGLWAIPIPTTPGRFLRVSSCSVLRWHYHYFPITQPTSFARIQCTM